MKAPSKMMVAAGALALTATTLLAGCGGSSTASTAAPAASEAPMSEAPAAEAPASVSDGLVKPVGVSDDGWLIFTDSLESTWSETSPEDMTSACNNGMGAIPEGAPERMMAKLGAGTVEEWTAVYTGFYENFQLMACSMQE